MDIEQIIENLTRNIDDIETTLTMTDDNRDVWRVWTNDLVWIRRLAKKDAKLVFYDEWGVAFDLEAGQVRFYSPTTEEERERARRLAEQFPVLTKP